VKRSRFPVTSSPAGAADPRSCRRCCFQPRRAQEGHRASRQPLLAAFAFDLCFSDRLAPQSRRGQCAGRQKHDSSPATLGSARSCRISGPSRSRWAHVAGLPVTFGGGINHAERLAGSRWDRGGRRRRLPGPACPPPPCCGLGAGRVARFLGQGPRSPAGVGGDQPLLSNGVS